MKIGIITDVHNNVIALNAILQLFEEKQCEKMFSNIDADIILYGHDHRGSIVYGNDKVYINCGSLGCTSTNEGVAQGGILTIEEQKPAFEKVFAKYDLKRVLDEIDSIKYPAYEDIKKFFYGAK